MAPQTLLPAATGGLPAGLAERRHGGQSEMGVPLGTVKRESPPYPDGATVGTTPEPTGAQVSSLTSTNWMSVSRPPVF